MADNDIIRNLLANPNFEVSEDLRDKRAELDKLLETKRYFRTNIYRQLTRDACDIRHQNIEPQTLQKYCPLDNGRLSKKEREAAGSRGLFARLPFELLTVIFVDMMDLAKLTTARSVSRGIRLMISSLTQYNAIVTHAPASLRATISMRAAGWTSCRDLYEQLCKPGCVQCGNFGAFLYIPTCQRVCYDCFTKEDQFKPVSVSRLKQWMGVKPKDLKDVCKVLTLPGYYHDPPIGAFSYLIKNKTTSNATFKRQEYVDAEIAASVREKIHGSKEAAEEACTHIRIEKYGAWQDKVAIWEAAPEASRTSRKPPVMPKGIFVSDRHASDPERHYCIVGFPWLNRIESTIDWGVGCQGCKNCLYSKDGFLWHMLFCEETTKIIAKMKLQEGKTAMEGKLIRMNASEKICHVAGDKSARLAQAQDVHGLLPGPCNIWYGKI